VSDRRQHPADLAVPAFKDGQFDDGLRLGGRFRHGGCRRDQAISPRSHIPPISSVPGRGCGLPARTPRDSGRVFRLEHSLDMDILGRCRRSVFQHDPFREPCQCLGLGNAVDNRPVGLGDMMLRVCELVEKVTVVGQKDQAFGVGVESPDGAQQRLTGKVNEVGDQPGSVDIAARADDSPRLVQRDVVAAGRRAHDMPIESHFVFRRIDFGAELGDDETVDSDAAFFDPDFTRPTGADPGGGEDFLQPFPRPLGVGRRVCRRGPAGCGGVLPRRI
jgi:hypothetical protein